MGLRAWWLVLSKWWSWRWRRKNGGCREEGSEIERLRRERSNPSYHVRRESKILERRIVSSLIIAALPRYIQHCCLRNEVVSKPSIRGINKGYIRKGENFYMRVHFELFSSPSCRYLCPYPESRDTSVHPALLAPSPILSFLGFFSSLRMLALQPLFLASLMFFAALLSALLGCRPSIICFWAK
jgi:hypothetical protein